jgi:hypothetical protein
MKGQKKMGLDGLIKKAWENKPDKKQTKFKMGSKYFWPLNFIFFCIYAHICIQAEVPRVFI